MVAQLLLFGSFWLFKCGNIVYYDYIHKWSYKAVGIYMDIGFIPMKKATYSNVKNEYDDALRTMKGKMREDKYKQFIELAEE